MRLASIPEPGWPSPAFLLTSRRSNCFGRSRGDSQVVVHPEGNSDKIPAEILRHGATHLQLTPSLLRALVSDPPSLDALGKLKKILVGGEALPASLIASLRQSFRGEIYNMYGPTETAIWSTVYRVQEQRSSIPIGKPIVNTQVYVLDSQNQLVPPGGIGNLLIGGDGVVRGYLNRPDLTAERFIRDPFRPEGRLYRTGDLARFLAGWKSGVPGPRGFSGENSRVPNRTG